MTIALWISLATLVLIAAVTLKLTVRLLAPKIDNGWDNAIGYVLASALLFLFPVFRVSSATSSAGAIMPESRGARCAA